MNTDGVISGSDAKSVGGHGWWIVRCWYRQPDDEPALRGGSYL